MSRPRHTSKGSPITQHREAHGLINLQTLVPKELRSRLDKLAVQHDYRSRTALMIEALETYCQVLESE